MSVAKACKHVSFSDLAFPSSSRVSNLVGASVCQLTCTRCLGLQIVFIALYHLMVEPRSKSCVKYLAYTALFNRRRSMEHYSNNRYMRRMRQPLLLAASAVQT